MIVQSESFKEITIILDKFHQRFQFVIFKKKKMIWINEGCTCR